MEPYSVTLYLAFVQVENAPKQPAAIERSITSQLLIDLFPL